MAASPGTLITCPVFACQHAPFLCTRPDWEVGLSQHLRQAHGEVCKAIYKPSNRVRPWRCPLCVDKPKTCFKSADSLALHLRTAHAERICRPAAAQAPSQAPCSDAAGPGPGSSAQHQGSGSLRLRLERGQSGVVVVGSWNLERFTIHAADTRLNGQKLTHISHTIREVAQAARGVPVILALQEVNAREAVPFLAQHLTSSSGRQWECAVSERLGKSRHYPEYGAFLWTAAPHMHADPATSFQTLSKEDFEEFIFADRAEGLAGGRPRAFLRSPFFGMFRVGSANLVLISVHLASDEAVSSREVGLLHDMAEAMRCSNKKLFHRYSFFGKVKSREPRGCCCILGDFNLPPTGGRAGRQVRNQPQPQHPNNDTHGHVTGNAAVWDAFRSKGWENLVDQRLATNWNAQVAKHFDNIFLPQALAAAMRQCSGVERQPAFEMADGAYPNHLMVWARLDLGPLQGGGGIGGLLGAGASAAGGSGKGPKVRPLEAPALALTLR